MQVESLGLVEVDLPGGQGRFVSGVIGHLDVGRLGGTLYGMVKTTVYLPEELEMRLDAEAAATGVSKAELIRRGIGMLLAVSDTPKRSAALPVFHSGRSRTAREMDDDIYGHIKQRSARR